MRRRSLSLALVLLILAGCSSTAPAPSAPTQTPTVPVDTAAPTPTPAPTPLPTPTAVPTLSFGWPDGDQPVVTRAQTGLSELFINPGAVIAADDGTLHMYANVFTAFPGRMSVMHLASSDGIEWSLAQPDPVLTHEDVPFSQQGMDVSTGYVTDDGTWTLIIMSVNLGAPGEIGRATGPGPDGPWTVDPEPILTVGPAGSFDSAGLAWPSVVPTDAGFAMYYTATDSSTSRGGVIAMAISDDGVEWTKAAEPVLEAEAAWEGGALDRARVTRVDRRYVMVYAGNPLTNRGVAWSEDGVVWERAGDEPAITADDFPIADNGAWDAALVADDGELTYYLEIGNASTFTEVYRAVAQLP